MQSPSLPLNVVGLAVAAGLVPSATVYSAARAVAAVSVPGKTFESASLRPFGLWGAHPDEAGQSSNQRIPFQLNEIGDACQTGCLSIRLTRTLPPSRMSNPTRDGLWPRHRWSDTVRLDPLAY